MNGGPGQRKRDAASLAQRDIVFFRERAAERAANEAKSARLRALRLAKEAEERVAAEAASAGKPARARRKARVK
jgi:hypothetical protein